MIGKVAGAAILAVALAAACAYSLGAGVAANRTEGVPAERPGASGEPLEKCETDLVRGAYFYCSAEPPRPLPQI